VSLPVSKLAHVDVIVINIWLRLVGTVGHNSFRSQKEF